MLNARPGSQNNQQYYSLETEESPATKIFTSNNKIANAMLTVSWDNSAHSEVEKLHSHHNSL
jgi:hypothetical protein